MTEKQKNRDTYGESAAKPRPGAEKSRLDKPASPDEDFAIDEQRAKQIRGHEGARHDHDLRTDQETED